MSAAGHHDDSIHPASAAGGSAADPPYRPDQPGREWPDQDLPVQAAHAAALASLPGIGPVTLARILAGRSPVEAWAEVRAGGIVRPPPRGGRLIPRAATSRAASAGAASAGSERSDGGRQAPLFEAETGSASTRTGPRRSWAEIARRIEPVEWWQPHVQAGVRVTWWGGPQYPKALVNDPEPPGVLFWRGRVECLDGLCVAIVGTRNATPDGRGSAFELGRDLAEAGVCVVSGLALGIDGAAHGGALSAVRAGAPGRTVGVAASGVDVPYPRRHTILWRDVTRAGAIVSETPPGRPAQAWRFPSRNRVIAGLTSMVIVVESHMYGGSLITAEAALQRGIEVRVVPGPVHSPASAGSNQLLYDGPGPVRNARDVLDALGILRPDPPPPARRGPPRPSLGSTTLAGPRSDPGSRRRGEPPSGPNATSRRVLDALGWRPASTNQVMARTGLDAATTHAALDGLVAEGYVSSDGGWWARKR